MPRSYFYRIYFCVVAAFVVGLAVFLAVFANWLRDYEAAQPEQIMTAFLSDDLEKGRLSAVRKKYGEFISKYESDDSLDKAFSALIKGKKLTFTTSSSRPEGCDIAYTVKADDERLMSVYLKRADKRYSISGVSFDKKRCRTYEITATSDASIFVNGVEVEAADRKDEALPDVGGAFAASGLICRQTVTLENMLGDEPVVTAKSGGAALEVEKNDDAYNVVQDFSEKDAVGAFAVKAAGVYAEYMQNDSSREQIGKFVDSGTTFYKHLMGSPVKYVIPHDRYAIKETVTSDFRKYSDDLFSCRVTLVNELTRGGKKYRDHFDKYVYLRRDGKTYKVLDMQNAADTAA